MNKSFDKSLVLAALAAAAMLAACGKNEAPAAGSAADAVKQEQASQAPSVRGRRTSHTICQAAASPHTCHKLRQPVLPTPSPRQAKAMPANDKAKTRRKTAGMNHERPKSAGFSWMRAGHGVRQAAGCCALRACRFWR